MRFVKQFSTAVTVAAVLAMPFGLLGCAKESSAPTPPAATDADQQSDLGTPEDAGSNL
ncbi:MAG: hypothetical protein KF861_20995 [Planctomycetaceae bacterium]|nr:hypothetical protein [Planctomycetaceae bacterium]